MLNEVKHLACGRNWVTNAGRVSFVTQILRYAQDDRLGMATASFVLPAAQRLRDSQGHTGWCRQPTLRLPWPLGLRGELNQMGVKKRCRSTLSRSIIMSGRGCSRA
jgi:hypothetical protein